MESTRSKFPTHFFLLYCTKCCCILLYQIQLDCIVSNAAVFYQDAVVLYKIQLHCIKCIFIVLYHIATYHFESNTVVM